MVTGDLRAPNRRPPSDSNRLEYGIDLEYRESVQGNPTGARSADRGHLHITMEAFGDKGIEYLNRKCNASGSLLAGRLRTLTIILEWL